MLFRKFAVDFAEKYRTSPIQLDEDSRSMLINYPWPGNVRELKNIAEQISVLSENKLITPKEIERFLPKISDQNLPMVLGSNVHSGNAEFMNERDILYKLFFDMKKDVTELKKMFLEILQNPSTISSVSDAVEASFLQDLPLTNTMSESTGSIYPVGKLPMIISEAREIQHPVVVEESLNIMEKEKELIEKALKKHKGKRKDASSDLGISERTLYRKLKEYDIEEL